MPQVFADCKLGRATAQLEAREQGRYGLRVPKRFRVCQGRNKQCSRMTFSQSSSSDLRKVQKLIDGLGLTNLTPGPQDSLNQDVECMIVHLAANVAL